MHPVLPADQFYSSGGLSASITVSLAELQTNGLVSEAKFYEKHLLLNWNSTPCSKREAYVGPRLPGGGTGSPLLSHTYSEAVLT